MNAKTILAAMHYDGISEKTRARVAAIFKSKGGSFARPVKRVMQEALKDLRREYEGSTNGALVREARELTKLEDSLELAR